MIERDGPVVNTSAEFRLYLRGFDDGAATAWRTAAELARTRISDADLRSVIYALAEKSTPPMASAFAMRRPPLPPPDLGDEDG